MVNGKNYCEKEEVVESRNCVCFQRTWTNFYTSSLASSLKVTDFENHKFSEKKKKSPRLASVKTFQTTWEK